jgi:ubiquinone/menaquinone biosynthesis C-methylase UbiE
VATFNKEAPTYDERHGASCGVAHGIALAAVTARGVVPERVVDVGCGTGALLATVARTWPGAALTGVDPAAAMIGIARDRLPAAELRVANAESLPLPDDSADLVLSTTSFNHWTDHPAALREIARVLVPGGLAVVVEHGPPGPLVAALLWTTGRMVRHHEPAGFVRLARAGGLHPLRATTEREGFVCLLAQSDPPASSKETP